MSRLINLKVINQHHDKENDKINSRTGKVDGNRVSNYNYDKPKTLTKEIEEESQVLREVCASQLKSIQLVEIF